MNNSELNNKFQDYIKQSNAVSIATSEKQGSYRTRKERNKEMHAMHGNTSTDNNSKRDTLVTKCLDAVRKHPNYITNDLGNMAKWVKQLASKTWFEEQCKQKSNSNALGQYIVEQVKFISKDTENPWSFEAARKKKREKG